MTVQESIEWASKRFGDDMFRMLMASVESITPEQAEKIRIMKGDKEVIEDGDQG